MKEVCRELGEHVNAICGQWKRGKLVAIIVAITAALSYYLLILKDFQSPDGYLEGFLLYHNAVWASANGRWLQKYLSLGTFNIVMPLFAVVLYMACMAVAIYLVIYLLRIEKVWSIIGISVVMTASPAIIEQLPYVYMAPAYAISFLFTVLYAFFNKKFKSVWFSLLGSVCLCMAMGLYQSYVGVSVSLAVMLLVMDLLDGGATVEWMKRMLQYLWSGVFGLILYYIIMKTDVTFQSLVMSKRAQDISLLESLVQFPKRFLYTYQCFLEYFSDWRIKRNVMYIAMFVIFALILFMLVISLAKKKKWKESLLFLLLIALLPPAMNCVAFICTEDPVRNLMSYQMVLIIPFGMTLLERYGKGGFLYLRLATVFICVLIGWTYVISANITYRCWDLSNRRIHFIAQNIVSDVMAAPEYEMGKRIVFAGYIDDSEVRYEYWLLYAHAIGMADRVIWWEGPEMLQRATRPYLLLNFGIDSGFYSMEEYYKIVNSDSFSAMGVWPKENSIAEINDIIVVKLSDNPPQ